jgi:hypothetical protein
MASSASVTLAGPRVSQPTSPTLTVQRSSQPTAQPNRTQEGYIKRMKDALSGDNLTIVVGTGVSIGAVKCSTAGVSEDRRQDALKRLTWPGLLLDGLKYLEEEFLDQFQTSEKQELQSYMNILKSGESAVPTLLRAAAFLKAKLVDCERLPDWLQHEFGDLYDEHIGNGTNPLLDAIRELFNANARIMTTNYDDLLSRHCNTSSIVPSEGLPMQRYFEKSDQRRGILHPHGVWSEPAGAVLDGVDYYKVTQHSSLQHSLKACLSVAEVVLFVGAGAGLNDPNFGQLLDWANVELGKGTKRHYILLRENERNERVFLNAVRYGPDYSDLPSFLGMLAQSGSRSM